MADSNNLTEVDLLAMAQAVDEGRDWSHRIPEPKDEEAECPPQEEADHATGKADHFLSFLGLSGFSSVLVSGSTGFSSAFFLPNLPNVIAKRACFPNLPEACCFSLA